MNNNDDGLNKVKYKSSKNKLELIIGVFLILLCSFLIVVFTYWIIISKLENRLNEITDIESNTINSSSNNYTTLIINFIKNDKIVCIAIPSLIAFMFILLYFKYIAINFFIRVS